VDKKQIAYLAAAFAVFGLVTYFFYPLLDGIVLGITFAYVATPAKHRMEKRIGERKASLLSTALIVAPIAVILLLGLFEITSQAPALIENINNLNGRFAELTAPLDPEVRSVIDEGISWAFSALRSFLQNLPVARYATGAVMLALNGFISIFVCYYLLVDGKNLSESLKKRVSEKTFRILETSSEHISDVFVGSFYFSIIISLASMPFFIYFDIPFWAIASGVMFLAAMIPIFAEWMVIALLSIYVLLVGGTAPFLIFLIIGLVFLYLVPEFILRPLFVGRYSDTHPLLLLLAFIGGGMAFGISGFFLAPMLVCAGIALWEEW